MNVSIILVNYNTKQLILDCIATIVQFTKSVTYEIIVVDNASSDGSQEILKSINDIVFIESNENLGFGRANNLGAKHAKGDFLLLLNSDTLLLEDSISKMYQFYISNQKKLSIGGLGCLLVDQNLVQNGTAYKFTSVFNVITSTLKLNVLQSTKYRKPYAYDELVTKVDFIIGADLLIKKDIFNDVNGFDSDFFMYFEEQDLQKRINTLGLSFYIINSTKIIHLEGGSTGVNKLSNRRRIMIQQGRNLYLKKNTGFKYYFYLLFDFVYSFFRLLNFNYSFKENLEFLRGNFKSY